MKKYIISLSIFILSINLTAQDKSPIKWTAKFSPAYYLDVSRLFDNYVDPTSGVAPDKTNSGKAFWGEVGYRLQNNIIVSGYFMLASYKQKYTDQLFKGQKYLVSEQNYAIDLGYEFALGKNHKLTPSVGLLLNIMSTTNVEYGLEYINSGWIINNLEIDDRDFPDLGFNITLDYYYQFKNNLLLGARLNAVYLFTVSTLESLVFSPVIGFKF
jgi:hypothetical protein